MRGLAAPQLREHLAFRPVRQVRARRRRRDEESRKSETLIGHGPNIARACPVVQWAGVRPTASIGQERRKFG
ncbi:hypothetical protein C725_1123 [Pacificimonas flava]|uniref:Uncharacterized protein n=1 Tax=Pacificimonas flava TaxID=1234595 RepID=M2U5C0_9SPHN|nr:hypothetical protein C725_1123 [Pacificimonas flava]